MEETRFKNINCESKGRYKGSRKLKREGLQQKIAFYRVGQLKWSQLILPIKMHKRVIIQQCYFIKKTGSYSQKYYKRKGQQIPAKPDNFTIEYHICQKNIEFYLYIQVPNVTSKNVSWLHFSWPTLYTRTCFTRLFLIMWCISRKNFVHFFLSHNSLKCVCGRWPLGELITFYRKVEVEFASL